MFDWFLPTSRRVALDQRVKFKLGNLDFQIPTVGWTEFIKLSCRFPVVTLFVGCVRPSLDASHRTPDPSDSSVALNLLIQTIFLASASQVLTDVKGHVGTNKSKSFWQKVAEKVTPFVKQFSLYPLKAEPAQHHLPKPKRPNGLWSISLTAQSCHPLNSRRKSQNNLADLLHSPCSSMKYFLQTSPKFLVTIACCVYKWLLNAIFDGVWAGLSIKPVNFSWCTVASNPNNNSKKYGSPEKKKHIWDLLKWASKIKIWREDETRASSSVASSSSLLMPNAPCCCPDAHICFAKKRCKMCRNEQTVLRELVWASKFGVRICGKHHCFSYMWILQNFQQSTKLCKSWCESRRQTSLFFNPKLHNPLP